MTDTLPLHGIRVLDIGGIGPGPFASMMLRQLGAAVIRLERPVSQDDYEIDPFADAGEKLPVDLKSKAGLALARSFVAQADILIEGYRPGVAERLGLSPPQCQALNPGLIYGRLTGWGQTGPLAQAAGHDINYIALSGALHAIGEPDGAPVIPLNLIGDFSGGSFYFVIAVLSALVERQRTGRGSVLDVAMVDGSAALMRMFYAMRIMGAWEDRRGVNVLDGGVPWYAVYETADGKHVAIGAVEQRFYDELIDRLGLVDAGLPPRGAEDGDRTLRDRLNHMFLSRTREEWCELLEGSDACFAPVLSLDETAAHPQIVARGIFADGLPRVAPLSPGKRGGNAGLDAWRRGVEQQAGRTA